MYEKIVENKTCVCETQMPPAATKLKSGKISVPHFDPIPSQGHVLARKYEKLLDELTIQVWLLYDHPNFKYCTLYVRDGITDRQTKGQTDDPIIRCPRQTFRAGA